jgi:hypothetical protein
MPRHRKWWRGLFGQVYSLMRPRQPIHPFGPVLLALTAVIVLGAVYGLSGAGKDAFGFALAAFALYALPVIAVFGIAGIVIGIRRLLRRNRVGLGKTEQDVETRKPPQLS